MYFVAGILYTVDFSLYMYMITTWYKQAVLLICTTGTNYLVYQSLYYIKESPCCPYICNIYNKYTVNTDLYTCTFVVHLDITTVYYNNYVNDESFVLLFCSM